MFLLIGPFFVFLAGLGPLLMWWNDERFDLAIIVILAAMAVAGVWVYLHHRTYEIRILEDGFTLTRFLRAPRTVEWRSVVVVRPSYNGDLRLELNDGSAVVVNCHLRGMERFFAIAEARLAPEVWRD